MVNGLLAIYQKNLCARVFRRFSRLSLEACLERPVTEEGAAQMIALLDESAEQVDISTGQS